MSAPGRIFIVTVTTFMVALCATTASAQLSLDTLYTSPVEPRSRPSCAREEAKR